jgi:hypothetical protein
MNRLFSAKPLLAAAVALGAVGAATTAQAHTDVFFSLGVPAPAYVAPAPVYVQPEPVYVQPQPVYVQPERVYVAPSGVTYYGYDRWGGRRHWRHEGWRDWDRDGDGVPNRYDRAPGNPYRR